MFIFNPYNLFFFIESVSYAYNLVFLFIPWIFSIWTKCCLISYCAMQIVKLKLTWSERSLRCSFPKLYQVTLNTRWFRYTRKFQSWRHKAAFPRRRHLRQFTVQCRLSERRFARWFTVESGLKAQIKAHGRRTCSWFFYYSLLTTTTWALSFINSSSKFSADFTETEKSTLVTQLLAAQSQQH